MARSLRDIRRKIKAVKSTRQVTKAMELVAGSKMRRAVQNASNLRQYASSAWHILQEIAQANGDVHPFLKERPIAKVLVILLTSDRGLCGSLNAHVLRAAERYIATLRDSKNAPFRGTGTFLSHGKGSREVMDSDGSTAIDFVAVGRKGQQFLRRINANVVAAFPAFSNHPKFRDILPLTKFAIEGFRNRDYDHIVLIYPEFLSAIMQEVDIKVLLPFSAEDLKKLAGEVTLHRKKKPVDDHGDLSVSEFVFEPSPREVLDVILPQLTEVQMYQAILEAAASEHSARMVAMRSASDNASEILDDLTLTYNQTRQAGITRELSELSASKAALEG